VGAGRWAGRPAGGEWRGHGDRGEREEHEEEGNGHVSADSSRATRSRSIAISPAVGAAVSGAGGAPPNRPATRARPAASAASGTSQTSPVQANTGGESKTQSPYAARNSAWI